MQGIKEDNMSHKTKIDNAYANLHTCGGTIWLDDHTQMPYCDKCGRSWNSEAAAKYDCNPEIYPDVHPNFS